VNRIMKNIAIVCGGNSGEYEISIESAKMVKKHLSPKKYNCYILFIKEKKWYYPMENGKKRLLNKADFSLTLENKTIYFDAVFNAIHGNPGENGRLPAYFDLLEIPYTSCGVDASVLSFNKYYCNHFVDSFGIKTAQSFSFTKDDNIDIKKVVETLGLPVFVKPSSSGSSVGVSKVKKADDLPKAIAEAFRYDNRIIVEEAIVGREIACGLLKYKNELLVFPLTEIVSENDFFDYEAKYHGKSDEITPAPIEEYIANDIKALSSFLFRKTDCRGFVRFDFILTDEDIYFLELNSIPGISAASIIPQQAQAFGLTMNDFFEMIVEEALEQKTRQ